MDTWRDVIAICYVLATALCALGTVGVVMPVKKTLLAAKKWVNDEDKINAGCCQQCINAVTSSWLFKTWHMIYFDPAAYVISSIRNLI